MTEDEMRIAVAELAGYVWYRVPATPNETRRYRMLAHPALHEGVRQIPGWTVRADGTENICNMKFMEDNGYVPNYPRDSDAIQAVVRDICGISAMDAANWIEFGKAVEADDWTKLPDRSSDLFDSKNRALASIGLASAMPPTLLCKALLLYKGKWKE